MLFSIKYKNASDLIITNCKNIGLAGIFDDYFTQILVRNPYYL